MIHSNVVLTQGVLDNLLPLDKSDAFFEALYGEAEEGAYDIKLSLHNITDDVVYLVFELHQRPGKCLVCSLTYGLPQVFQRHPLINTAGIAKSVATILGWDEQTITWELGRTEEHSALLHTIPFIIKK